MSTTRAAFGGSDARTAKCITFFGPQHRSKFHWKGTEVNPTEASQMARIVVTMMPPKQASDTNGSSSQALAGPAAAL